MTKQLICLISALFISFNLPQKTTTIYLIGDSTMTDYALEEDYDTKRYPQVGWGQMFHDYMNKDSLKAIQHLIQSPNVKLDVRAKGGRSTRTFFEEGRWRSVYENLNKDDIVIIQFGHNDAATQKPERFVNVSGYKEYLKLFIDQTKNKGAKPILLTPVARNYPWKNNVLQDVHGEYAQAAIEVAQAENIALIDLNSLSRQHFTAKGKVYVTNNYFMNFPADKYPNYPKGLNDNTHFLPEGGKAVAQIVFDALKKLPK